MNNPILSTKLFIPQLRSKIVSRSRLKAQLNKGISRKLTLITASAGFGKTTAAIEWLSCCDFPVAWLSLDEKDNDQTRFLNYLCAALQSIGISIGKDILGALQAAHPLQTESVLTVLLNEIAAIPHDFILVLDDYHVLDDERIDHAIAYFIENMPPQMHLVILSREEPRFQLAWLRVQNQITVVRSNDLQFTASESAEFLSQVMELSLTKEEMIQLTARTEGWIAGLQLAALSIQEHQDKAHFIQSFTGNHKYVLDYLVEEVLSSQSENIQLFLMYTSILERMCGSLCDAVLLEGTSGEEVLSYLEHMNLFIVPLDNERCWYRYHHLFASLLRDRLQKSNRSVKGNEHASLAELHIRASKWHEDNGFDMEAFYHAKAANDIDRSARLAEGKGMSLLFRGEVRPVLSWLDSMSEMELNKRPSLWVMFASALLMTGQTMGVHLKLQAAEEALLGIMQDEQTNDIIGHIASIRATLAASKHQATEIMTESNRALQYLHPDNLPVRTATTWTLGYAHQLQGNRLAASKAYTEALTISENIGHVMIAIMAALGLGNIQESENHLYLAAETYRRVIKTAGNPPLPAACEAYLGLARIFYQWNDLDAALEYGKKSIQLALQLQQTDRVVAGEAFLAKLKFARGEASNAIAMIAAVEQIAIKQNFAHQMSPIVETHVFVLLQQGNLAAAANLAQKHDHRISQVRVQLAQGDASAALALLNILRDESELRMWLDEKLKIQALIAVAFHVLGQKVKAVQTLIDALTVAEPGGYIRVFVDEGIRMNRLLREATTQGMLLSYMEKLLNAFEAEPIINEVKSNHLGAMYSRSLIEPLSERELEVLQLIAQGLSNREISKRLFLALSTVKGHIQIIFNKLQVKRRTEAVARARDIDLL